jgi:hypothetical protein
MMVRMAVILAAGLVLVGGVCEIPTSVKGTLSIAPEVSGDVRASAVSLYPTSDLSGPAAAGGAAADTGAGRSVGFELADVPAGKYYLLAWQDVDDDGVIDDGDLVGLRGAGYQPGLGGQVLEVVEGALTDAGGVEMKVYLEPLDTVTGALVPTGDTTVFRYSFNHDLELSALSIAFPGIGTLTDPEAAGEKLAGVLYESGGWSAGGAPMPTGIHRVSFRGTLESSRFDVSREVDVR